MSSKEYAGMEIESKRYELWNGSIESRAVDESVRASNPSTEKRETRMLSILQWSVQS